MTEVFYAIAGLAFLGLMGLAMRRISMKKKKDIASMREADPELVKAALAEMEEQ